MKAERGTIVTIHYDLTDAEGTVLDSSKGGEPLSYLHGYGSIVKGLERELEGREPGQKTEVTLAPEDAYGERSPEAMMEVPRSEFPEGMEPEPGMTVQADTPGGAVYLQVNGVTEDQVTLDGNHPLAGKTLHFDVEVTDVRAATDAEEEKARGHDH
ncbi:MAG TPA: peptidylprolyl isomerase [Thermoleophilia bacterium]|nr:peptidylprolyl isomerase [Thermoleophilia bacterium]